MARRIDLVVCHSHTLAALAACRLKKKHGVPYVLIVHGDIFERPRGTYDPWLTALYKAVTPPAYRQADLVIALSPHMVRWAVASGARADRVVVVPNGIDPTEIGIEENGVGTPMPQDELFHLLYVGRLSVEKGAGVLLEACRVLKSQGLPFALRVIGRGPLEHELRNVSVRLGLSTAAIFLGAVERQTLGRHYAWANVVCVPSLSDSLPAVVLEALAAGRPVVGTNVGGIPWMVDDGLTGRVVEPGSASALAGAVRELAANPGQLQEMGVRAAASIFPRFSWVEIGSRIRSLVRYAMDSSRHDPTQDRSSLGAVKG